MSPLDLHVLSTPPAFVLSQDQTLAFNPLSHPTAFAVRLTHSESSVSSYLRLSILYRFQGSSALGESLYILSKVLAFVNTFFEKNLRFFIFFENPNSKCFQGVVRSYALTRKYQIVQMPPTTTYGG